MRLAIEKIPQRSFQVCKADNAYRMAQTRPDLVVRPKQRGKQWTYSQVLFSLEVKKQGKLLDDRHCLLNDGKKVLLQIYDAFVETFKASDTDVYAYGAFTDGDTWVLCKGTRTDEKEGLMQIFKGEDKVLGVGETLGMKFVLAKEILSLNSEKQARDLIASLWYCIAEESLQARADPLSVPNEVLTTVFCGFF